MIIDDSKNPEMQTDILSSREILSILFERKWSILSVFFGVLVTTVFLVYFIVTPTYEANAKIILNLNDLTGPILSAGGFVSDMEKLTDFHTQKDIISSVVFSERVVDELDLEHVRSLSRVELIKLSIKDFRRDIGSFLGIDSWMKPHDPRGASIAAVNSNFRLETRPESRAFDLIYRARNPVEAERTLNSIVENYIQYHQESLNQRAVGLIEYLEQQTARVNSELTEAELMLLEFRQNDTLAEHQLIIAETAAAANVESSFAGITDSTEVQDELKLYILRLEEELRDLNSRYAPNDPNIVELRNKINSYVETVNAIPEREMTLSRLRRVIELNQEVYLLMRKNVEQIKMVAAGQTSKLSRISVIEPAQAGDDPVSPKTKLLIILSILMGAVLSMTWAFLLHYLDHTIGSVREINRYLGLSNLGHLPEIK